MQFPKRSKAADFWGDLSKNFSKSPAYTLTTKAAVSSPVTKDVLSNPVGRSSPASKPRTVLQPKSPSSKLKARNAAPSPLTTPAGRSPPRAGKRMGILSRRRAQRPDPPAFSQKTAVPFSLDAALRGTIPSYSGSLRQNKPKSRSTAASSNSSSSGSNAAQDFFIPTPDMASFWSFDIHEDTPEQEMTNLLQHGTCTLDISSDEEFESRANRDRAEGRDKENIPPPEDVSQTSSARGGPLPETVEIDEDVLLLKGRGPLAEMNVTDYYAEGCDSSSVFIVPGDEEDPEAVVEGENVVDELGQELPPLPADGEDERQWFAEEEDANERFSRLPPSSAPQVSLDDVEQVDVDDVMGGNDRSLRASRLAPIEEAENFELWESHSAQDERSAPTSPSPLTQ